MGLNTCAANGVAVLIPACNSVGPQGVRVLASSVRPCQDLHARTKVKEGDERSLHHQRIQSACAREICFLNPTHSHTQINTTAQELGDRKHGFVNANTVASSTVCGHRQ